jgi:predicted DNA-binding antitoxin AbrB/MazE fold protein
MTITIDATYEDGVLKPAEPLPLGEHARVRVTVEPRGEPSTAEAVSPPTQPARRSISERLAELAESVPEEVVDSWPKDGASQHDHYLYGAPKRRDLPE